MRGFPLFRIVAKAVRMSRALLSPPLFFPSTFMKDGPMQSLPLQLFLDIINSTIYRVSNTPITFASLNAIAQPACIEGLFVKVA